MIYIFIQPISQLFIEYTRSMEVYFLNNKNINISTQTVNSQNFYKKKWNFFRYFVRHPINTQLLCKLILFIFFFISLSVSENVIAFEFILFVFIYNSQTVRCFLRTSTPNAVSAKRIAEQCIFSPSYYINIQLNNPTCTMYVYELYTFCLQRFM